MDKEKIDWETSQPSPDGYQFKHLLCEKWFNGLAACGLDYQRKLWEQVCNEKEN